MLSWHVVFFNLKICFLCSFWYLTFVLYLLDIWCNLPLNSFDWYPYSTDLPAILHISHNSILQGIRRTVVNIMGEWKVKRTSLRLFYIAALSSSPLLKRNNKASLKNWYCILICFSDLANAQYQLTYLDSLTD